MNSEQARRQMVEQQVRAWEVYDPAVLDVMQLVARDQFVDAQYIDVAYADAEIPIGEGQLMMAPVVEGRLLQALDLQPAESVLEVGTGSGYLTACLAELAGKVTSVDIRQKFTKAAAVALDRAGIENVTLECMDVMAEMPEGQYDAIAVTGSIPEPDERFLQCLKPGGRMFVVVGRLPVMQAQLVRQGDSGEWSGESLFETELAVLDNVPVENAFRF